MFARSALAVALTLGGLASAQLPSNITLSSQCTSALTSILANADASSCLSLGAVIPILSLPTNTSLIPSVQTWLGAMCAAQPCSNATLDFVTSTLLTGCEQDLVNDGLVPTGTSISTSEAQQTVEQEYAPTREVACSKTGGNYCLINTLNSIQTLVGQPLSMSTLMTADWVTLANTADLSSLCTACNQAAYATLKAQVPGVSGSQVEQVIASRCGSSFISGGVPGDVTLGSQGANTASGAKGLTAAVLGMLGSAGLVGAMLV